MKKFIGIAIVVTLTILFCTACEVSNTELANSLDGNMTRLVYSIGYLDSISSSEINELISNSSYFVGVNSTINTNNSGANLYRNSNYRTNSYSVAGTASTNPVDSDVKNSGDAQLSELGGLYAEGIAQTGITPVNNETRNTSTNLVDISLLQTSANDLNDILLAISQKRGIIMLYCTDLRSGNSSLGLDDKNAISEYISIIKETTTFLNNSAGNLTAYVNNIKNVAYHENSQEIINAKLIRANEVLKTRYAKLDTCIDSLNAIIAILQRNIGTDYSSTFLNNSNYAGNNISGNANNTLNNSTFNNNVTDEHFSDPIDTTNKIDNYSTNSVGLETNNTVNDRYYDTSPNTKPDTIINYNYYDKNNNLPENNIQNKIDSSIGYQNNLDNNINGNTTYPSIQNNLNNGCCESNCSTETVPTNPVNNTPRLKTEEFNSPLTGDPKTQRSVNSPNPSSIISNIVSAFQAHKYLMPIYSEEETFKLMPFHPNDN